MKKGLVCFSAIQLSGCLGWANQMSHLAPHAVQLRNKFTGTRRLCLASGCLAKSLPLGGGGCFPGGKDELVQHPCGPGQQATTCGFIVELDWVTVMVLGSVESKEPQEKNQQPLSSKILVAFHPRPQIASDLGRNVTRSSNPHLKSQAIPERERNFCLVAADSNRNPCDSRPASPTRP